MSPCNACYLPAASLRGSSYSRSQGGIWWLLLGDSGLRGDSKTWMGPCGY